MPQPIRPKFKKSAMAFNLNIASADFFEREILAQYKDFVIEKYLKDDIAEACVVVYGSINDVTAYDCDWLIIHADEHLEIVSEWEWSGRYDT